MFLQIQATGPQARKAPFLIVLFLLALAIYGCTSTRSDTTSTNDEQYPVRFSEGDAKSYDAALHLLESDSKQALGRLQKLAQKYPNNVNLLINLAVAHIKLDEFAKAKEISSRAIELNSSIAAAYNTRGLAALNLNEFHEAEEDFLQALALQKGFSMAHYNLGLLYDIYFQDITRALGHYEQYLRDFPEDEATRAWVDQLQRSLNKG